MQKFFGEKGVRETFLSLMLCAMSACGVSASVDNDSEGQGADQSKDSVAVHSVSFSGNPLIVRWEIDNGALAKYHVTTYLVRDSSIAQKLYVIDCSQDGVCKVLDGRSLKYRANYRFARRTLSNDRMEMKLQDTSETITNPDGEVGISVVAENKAGSRGTAATSVKYEKLDEIPQ